MVGLLGISMVCSLILCIIILCYKKKCSKQLQQASQTSTVRSPFYDNERGTVASITNPPISFDDNPLQAVNAQPPSYNPYYHDNDNVPDHDPSDPLLDYDTVN